MKLNYKLPKSLYPIDIHLMSFETANNNKFDCKGRGHSFYNQEDSWIVIAVDLEKYDLTTLIHECLHASLFILDYIGLKVNDENSEALCYLNDFIFKKVYDRILKIKPLENKK